MAVTPVGCLSYSFMRMDTYIYVSLLLEWWAQYEPGYDNFFRLIKGLYVTSTPTGLVTSWPVPGNKGVHVSWTYDIDAQDSYELALVVAQDLQSRGIRGTINWQAKLVKDAYDIASL